MLYMNNFCILPSVGYFLGFNITTGDHCKCFYYNNIDLRVGTHVINIGQAPPY